MTDPPFTFHHCADECCCPEHGDMMFYSPGSDTHACVREDCRYTHGYEPVLDQEIQDARRARRESGGPAADQPHTVRYETVRLNGIVHKLLTARTGPPEWSITVPSWPGAVDLVGKRAGVCLPTPQGQLLGAAIVISADSGDGVVTLVGDGPLLTPEEFDKDPAPPLDVRGIAAIREWSEKDPGGWGLR